MNAATLIIQSAPAQPPAWLDRCMATVAAWAARRGYAYTRLDDALFEIVPADIRARLGPQARIQLSDIARLLWIARGLATGHARVAWIDSDILLFDPGRFDLPGMAFACGRELWVWIEGGGMRFRSNATNAPARAGLDRSRSCARRRVGAAMRHLSRR